MLTLIILLVRSEPLQEAVEFPCTIYIHSGNDIWHGNLTIGTTRNSK